MLIILVFILTQAQTTINKRFLQQGSTTILIQEPLQKIRDRITQLISQKQKISSNRSLILTNLTAQKNATDQLRLNLLSTKLEIKSLYNSYHDTRIQCNLHNYLDIIQDNSSGIIDTSCKILPISSQSIKINIQLIKLKGQQYTMQQMQKIYNILQNITDCLSTERQIYINVSQFYHKLNMVQFYNKYYNLANSVQQFLQVLKQETNRYSSGLAQTNISANLLGNISFGLSTQCIQKLTDFQTQLKQKIGIATSLEQKITLQETIIKEGFSKLDQIGHQLTTTTSKMNQLAEQYSALVKSQ